VEIYSLRKSIMDNKKTYLLITLFLSAPLILFSQFSQYSFTEPHRFSELGWGAGNNTRGEKCIAVFGNNIYITAEANGGGSTMQCYRSTDVGTSWDTLGGLGWSDSRFLSLAIDDGGRVYLTWFYMNMTFPGLCKTAALYTNTFQSTGTGNTWVDWYLNLYFASAPSVAARGNTEGNPLICASQESFDGTSYFEIVLDCPQDPMAWNNFNYWNGPPYHDHYLTYLERQIRPCIRLDDGHYAHIVWEDNRAGVLRVAFRRSSNILSSGGPWPLTWNSLIYIDDTGHNTKGTTTGYFQGHVQMVVKGSGSTATDYIVWVSSDNNIYFDKSTDGGATWGTDVRVNDDISANREWPSIALDGSDNIYVVWMDDRDGNNNIYFSYSMDGGATFSPDTFVHSGAGDDKFPGIEAGTETDLSELHIGWTRADTTLYSKATPVPTGISEVTFNARCTENAIVLRWEVRGYSQGTEWIVYRRDADNQNYSEIVRYPVNNSQTTYTHSDGDIMNEIVHFYRLVLIDRRGVELCSRITSITPRSPQRLELSVFSNPSKKILIRYGITQREESLSLNIYDSSGRLVKRFSKGELLYSTSVTWNGRTDNGLSCPSGSYFVILKNGSERKTVKCILIQ
jgi:hypothetical protein